MNELMHLIRHYLKSLDCWVDGKTNNYQAFRFFVVPDTALK